MSCRNLISGRGRRGRVAGVWRTRKPHSRSIVTTTPAAAIASHPSAMFRLDLPLAKSPDQMRISDGGLVSGFAILFERSVE